MKLIVKDIPKKGLELTENISAADIGLLEQELKCLSPLNIKAKISRVDNTILAHFDIHGQYEFACARCLEPVTDTHSDSFDFDYPIESSMQEINLGEDIRQEMIMRLPTRILCKPDCLGLCSKCGVNLNKEKCKCSSGK